MKNNNNIIQKSTIIDESILFYQSYFFIAELGCQELLDGKHKRGIHGFPLPYMRQDLIIPIIYNVKHGIEIFLKQLF